MVLGVQSRDPELKARALEVLTSAYWRPVHRHIRTRLPSREQEAEDLAQGFFAAALEKGWLERYDPTRGRFRSYLLACLQAYLANEHRAGQRLKRGGGATLVPLQSTGPDGRARELELEDGTDLEAEFQRQWARGLFSQAVAALRSRCQGTLRSVAFAAFERYDLEADAERPSYARLAVDLGIPVTQVTNHLHWARRELRKTLLEKLRQITASDEEFRAEARALFGADTW